MPHTFTNVLAHVIFSTKDGLPDLEPDLPPRLFGYVVGILRELDANGLELNGPADHAHLLVVLPATLAL